MYVRIPAVAAVLLVLFGSVARPATAAAQTLKAGIWTGTVAPPEKPVMTVTYDVRVSRDTTYITLRTAQNVFPFSDVRMEAGKLRFSFTAGTSVVFCDLSPREDGSWGGPCAESGGEPGELVMIPPTF